VAGVQETKRKHDLSGLVRRLLFSARMRRGEHGAQAVDYEGEATYIRTPPAAIARLERLATSSLLATGLAHEIANPLSALMVAHDGIGDALRALRRTETNGTALDQVAADLEMASTAASTIAHLIRDFQTFLRPDEHTPMPVPNEVRPAVERAVRMARPRISGVASLSVILTDTPLVAMPASRITQIVLNLLLNAADALTDSPSVTKAGIVEVRLFVSDGRPVIEVQDNGPGMSPAMRAALFEPGRTTKAQGTSLGLGLAISRQLARAAGGDITADFAPNRGMIFRVTVGPPSAR
jgi:two-component system C4-dicarboxylate transport sensor histidine kinase DctB